jgi:ubiquinone/menaquinone biosynthesis C-methylase UbiE
VDINPENLDYCRQRFASDPGMHYVKTDGASLRGIRSGTVTLLYSFDSMVHFDSDVVRAYLQESYRVLRPGGRCFFHHSNYTGNPGGDFKDSPHWRNFMSKELFAHYSIRSGLQVLEQRVIDWTEPDLDCLTLLEKPDKAS